MLIRLWVMTVDDMIKSIGIPDSFSGEILFYPTQYLKFRSAEDFYENSTVMHDRHGTLGTSHMALALDSDHYSLDKDTPGVNYWSFRWCSGVVLCFPGPGLT